jgi:hypothetical protein
MARAITSQYFCSGCGAIRNENTRRCISCGRVFHDEVDTSETTYSLTHPQTKAPYRRRSKFALLFDELFTFRSLMLIIGSALALLCLITFLPDIIGVKTNATITHLEALHCKDDCQFQVFYSYIGADNKTYTGMFHQTFTDTYFHPPVEGAPTPIRYIPYLPVIPPRSPNSWFPIGVLLAGIFGLGMVIFAARGQFQ